MPQFRLLGSVPSTHCQPDHQQQCSQSVGLVTLVTHGKGELEAIPNRTPPVSICANDINHSVVLSLSLQSAGTTPYL